MVVKPCGFEVTARRVVATMGHIAQGAIVPTVLRQEIRSSLEPSSGYHEGMQQCVEVGLLATSGMR